MRRLSKEAKRKRVGVADVIYEDVESFVAKCVAEADLEEKVIKFPTVARLAAKPFHARARVPVAVTESIKQPLVIPSSRAAAMRSVLVRTFI